MSIYKYMVLLNVAYIRANVHPDQRPESGGNSYLANTMEHLLDGMENLTNKVNAIETRLDDAVNAILLKLDELKIGVDAASISKAEWQTWSSFTSCSMSCKPVGSNGTIFRTRTRQCEYVIPNIRTNGLPRCEGNRTEIQSCKLMTCLASISKAEWQTWSSFTSCSMSCKPVGSNGTIFRTRTRQCEYVIPNTRTNAVPRCEGNRTEIQSCELMTCPVSSEYFGGNGGHPFDDSTVSTSKNITAISLLCGTHFASFHFRYGDLWGPIHGWMVDRYPKCGLYYNVQAKGPLEFGSMEYIKQINITYGNYINSVSFITNERALGTCGTSNGTNQRTVEGPGRLLYMSGRAGCIIDGLKFHWSGDSPN